MKLNQVVVQLIWIMLLTSCSQRSIMKIMAKTPKVKHNHYEGFSSFSAFQKDAVYTVELVKETYPRLYEKVPDFDEKAKSFIAKASKANSEKKFDFALKRFVAVLKDGHSSYSIDYSKYDKTSYAIYIYKEKDNWIIGNIDRDIDSTVIGKKILSINQISISEIENRISELESGENEYWKFAQAASQFKSPTFWEAIDITSSGNRTLNFEVNKKTETSTFTLEDKEKRTYYKVKTKERKYPFRFQQNSGFYDTISTDQNFAYLQMNTSLDYVSIKSEIDNYTTFITKPIALAYLKKKKKNALDFGEFLQSFFKRVHSQKIDNLIIDLSYNTGGDERTGKQLIWYLTEVAPEGFTEYIQNSEYFRTQIKVDSKKYNDLYRMKYNSDLPSGEVNITDKLFNEPYFTSLTEKDSPFLLDKTIPKFKGKVYVIVGSKTFSAGQILATTIADNGLATIIGTPTGNQPTSQTGASMFKLPETKKIVAISYVFMERPDKSKNHELALYPNIEIYKTYEDLISGEDKVMKYILSQ